MIVGFLVVYVILQDTGQNQIEGVRAHYTCMTTLAKIYAEKELTYLHYVL